MFLIGTYIGGVSVIGAYLFVAQYKKKRKNRLYAQRILQQVNYLRLLLEMLPKHRGMANALLKGDNAFRKPITDLQKAIDEQLKALSLHTLENRSACTKHTVQNIQKHWLHIQSSLHSMEAAESFRKHTKLIAVVMEYLDDTGLYLENAISNKKNVQSLLPVVTRELPHALESMGQARGIGTGVAAQGSSTAANRINLKFLHGKTLQIVNQQLAPIAKRLGNNLQSGQPAKKLNTAVQNAQDFLDALNRELIQSDRPVIKPDDYYKQGTKAIDAGFVLFDSLLEQWAWTAGLQVRR